MKKWIKLGFFKEEKMHKEIERAVLRITQAMEKNRKNYDDYWRYYSFAHE